MTGGDGYEIQTQTAWGGEEDCKFGFPFPAKFFVGGIPRWLGKT